ncbi:MAG: hypothetical protein QNL12_06075, partial [Acidimicrobiia bacterium]|nr:hypothetical protein [Acidimicrobiia bacterium]MDX2466862.1 hypothetical protein [Acidimicrobiia bacterium]
MKFIVRKGSDPIAQADSTLLTALGLPGGGIVAIGKTHVLVSPGDTASPNAMMLGERSIANAGLSIGDS